MTALRYASKGKLIGYKTMSNKSEIKRSIQKHNSLYQRSSIALSKVSFSGKYFGIIPSNETNILTSFVFEYICIRTEPRGGYNYVTFDINSVPVIINEKTFNTEGNITGYVIKGSVKVGDRIKCLINNIQISQVEEWIDNKAQRRFTVDSGITTLHFVPPVGSVKHYRGDDWTSPYDYDKNNTKLESVQGDFFTIYYYTEHRIFIDRNLNVISS